MGTGEGRPTEVGGEPGTARSASVESGRGTGSGRSLRRLALAGVVGPVAWWLLVAVNGAITPGYSHVGDFISTLGAVGAPYAVVQQVNFAVFGTSVGAFALGVHRYFGDDSRPRFGTLLLGVFALGVVLSGPIQSDPAAPGSTTAVLHDLVGSVAFLAVIVAVPLVSRRLDADDRWPRYPYETLWTAAVVVATFVLFVSTVESAWLGLTQRLFVGAVSAWVAGQSYRLYRLTTPAGDGSADA